MLDFWRISRWLILIKSSISFRTSSLKESSTMDVLNLNISISRRLKLNILIHIGWIKGNYSQMILINVLFFDNSRNGLMNWKFSQWSIPQLFSFICVNRILGYYYWRFFLIRLSFISLRFYSLLLLVLQRRLRINSFARF